MPITTIARCRASDDKSAMTALGEHRLAMSAAGSLNGYQSRPSLVGDRGQKLRKLTIAVVHCRPLSSSLSRRRVLLLSVVQICRHDFGGGFSGLLLFELVGDVAEGFTAITAPHPIPAHQCRCGKRHRLSSKPTLELRPHGRDRRYARHRARRRSRSGSPSQGLCLRSRRTRPAATPGGVGGGLAGADIANAHPLRVIKDRKRAPP